MRTLIVVTSLVAVTPVLAQDAGTGPSGQKPAPPRPAPALTETFKGVAGTWSCTGSMDNPESPGTQVKTKSEARFSPIVDGFAYSGVFRIEKNAAMPKGAKMIINWGYDQARGKLVEVGFDSVGSYWQGTSDGEKDGTTVWAEEGVMMGQPIKSRTTVTRKSPTEFTVVTEMENKGAWQKLGEDHCRKK